MLTLDHYELIRCKHEIDGMTLRGIAKELGHSRKTVAKALKERIPPGYRLSQPRGRPVIEPVKHIIDAWLEQNKKARPKHRQTAKRIYGIRSVNHILFFTSRYVNKIALRDLETICSQVTIVSLCYFLEHSSTYWQTKRSNLLLEYSSEISCPVRSGHTVGKQSAVAHT